MSIFEYSDYRSFMKELFQRMPKQGYGQAYKLARFLGVHTTLVSQVLKKHKTFTLEQASTTAEFLGLNDLESEYFLSLVQIDRAGNEALRKILKRQLSGLRKKAADLSNRLSPRSTLRDELRATFYSDWTYSAVRQLTAIPTFDNIEDIAARLSLPRKQVKNIIDFLLRSGLCKEEKGKLSVGPSSTHLEVSSPWIKSHHCNWRQKAIQEINREDDLKLHYSSPLTLSKSDAARVREMLIKCIDEVDKVIDPSPSEELRCLNIDWFRI